MKDVRQTPSARQNDGFSKNRHDGIKPLSDNELSQFKRELRDKLDSSGDLVDFINSIDQDSYFKVLDDSLLRSTRDKQSVLQMSERFFDLYAKTGIKSYLARSELIESCGDHVVFGATGNVVYFSGCRDRLCPRCAIVKSRRTLKELRAITAYLRLTQPELKYFMFTLTVPNCAGSDLHKTLKSSIKAFGRFMDQRYMAFITGYYRSIEITYNSDTGMWHPHIHVLVSVDEYKFYDLCKRYDLQSDFLQREWTRLNAYTYNDFGAPDKRYKFTYALDPEHSDLRSYPFCEFDDHFDSRSYTQETDVVYLRTNQPCDHTTVLYEYDRYLNKRVVSSRNLLQVECHEFVDFENSNGLAELCKYVSKSLFDVQSLDLDEFQSFVDGVKGIVLVHYGKEFSKILKLFDDFNIPGDPNYLNEFIVNIIYQLNKMKTLPNEVKSDLDDQFKDSLRAQLTVCVHVYCKKQYSYRLVEGKSYPYHHRFAESFDYVYSGSSYLDFELQLLCRSCHLIRSDQSLYNKFERWRKYILNKLKE